MCVFECESVFTQVGSLVQTITDRLPFAGDDDDHDDPMTGFFFIFIVVVVCWRVEDGGGVIIVGVYNIILWNTNKKIF